MLWEHIRFSYGSKTVRIQLLEPMCQSNSNILISFRISTTCMDFDCLFFILSLFTAEQDGIIEFYHDEDIASRSIQLRSDNLSTTSITCPPDNSKSLGIRLPILVLLVKNLGEHFSFEVQVLDNKGNRRRFRASNFQVSS